MTKKSSKQLLLRGEDRNIFNRCGKLFFSRSVGETECFLVNIPCSFAQRVGAAFSLTERMLRLIPRCAAWVDEDTFVFARKGRIFCVKISERSVCEEHTFQSGMSAPLNFCPVSSVPGFTDGLLYGSYITHYGNTVIRRRNAAGEWKEVYRFPEGRILHIHGIIADAPRERLLILTGDSDEESGIWEARNDFAYVRLLLGGSQQYRSCVAFPEEGHILFATDTPLEDNHLYDFDETTGRVAEVCPLPGPVICGTAYEKNGMLHYAFSTSVEPDSRLTGVRYLLTSRLGAGVKTRSSFVFSGSRKTGFQQVAAFPKDGWPMGLFQFGNVFFPGGTEKNLYLCPQSVKKYTGKTMEVTE